MEPTKDTVFLYFFVSLFLFAFRASFFFPGTFYQSGSDNRWVVTTFHENRNWWLSNWDKQLTKKYTFSPTRVSNTNHIPPTTILHHPPPKFNYIKDENGISSPIFFFFLHLGNFVKKGFLFVFYFSGIDRDPIFSWHSIKKNASFLVFTYWHKK